ncbi:YIP1 family protein [Vibrio sp. JC009]|uniref:YIP1 family protein n=1 Tax=Vibrio sp. JC009 TaxID=2912314 RepID=UPI0023B0CDAA|nr:YIP1 family protein [Vibrio sp. JC009]WED21163.1 YIP1 family protein [Vibrio sp. JC009]
MIVEPSRNPLVLLLDIFRSPTSCFAALYQRGMWGWFLFIILLLSPFVFWGSYFDIVDFNWLKSNLIPQLTAVAPDQIALLDKNTLMASEIMGDIFNRIVGIALLAFWFLVATKPSQYQFGYWKWCAASCVVMFPAILGDFASYVSVLIKHGQVMYYAADLNSLNGLLKLPLTSEWSAFASSLPLLLPWYIVLSYSAIGAWTEFNKTQALKIAILPWVGFYLVWALQILLF